MTSFDRIMQRLDEIERKIDRLAAGGSVQPDQAPAESVVEMKAIAKRARVVGLKQALEEFGRAPKDGRRKGAR